MNQVSTIKKLTSLFAAYIKPVVSGGASLALSGVMLIGLAGCGGQTVENLNKDYKAYLDGKKGTKLVRVVVTPSGLTKPVNVSQQYEAIAVYSNNTTKNVTADPGTKWTTSDIDAAEVDSSGIVRTKDAGEVKVRAAYSEKTGSADLIIVAASLDSIQVTPADLTRPKGVSIQYTATGYYTYDGNKYLTHDMTDDPYVTWDADPAGIATISNAAGTKGVAVTAAAGSTDIKAAHQIDAGLLTEGSTSLTVTNYELISLSIQPLNRSLAKNFSLQYTATGTFSDGTNQYTLDMTRDASIAWSSSAIETAEIVTSGDRKGLATGIKAGTSTIKATSMPGGTISAEATLTVTDATLVSIMVSPPDASRQKNVSIQYTATGVFSDDTTLDLTNDPGISWVSSKPDIASIDGAGLAYTLSAGDTQIRATHSGKTGATTLIVNDIALVRIDLLPATASKPVNTTQQYMARAVYSNGTSIDITNDSRTAWTWISSGGGSVSVSDTGFVYTLAAGTVTIRASLSGITGEAELEVTAEPLASITVTPAETSLPVGLSAQFTATGYYGGVPHDLTNNPNIAWTSSDLTKATVNNSGLARALAAGSPTIKAALSGISGTATLNVSAPDLDYIQVTPLAASRPRNAELQYMAEAVYNNGMVIDITSDPETSWISSNTNAAVIDPSGLAYTVGAGTAAVRATFRGVTGEGSLTVTSATLSSIIVTPAAIELPVGAVQQYTATGIYSDGSSLDLTADTHLSWTTSDSTMASISPEGLALTKAAGAGETVTVSAIHSAGRTGTASLAIKDVGVILSSIEVTPPNLTLPINVYQQYSAAGVYSDGSRYDISAHPELVWSTGNSARAVITSSGMVHTLSEGISAVVAELGAIDGSTDLTVLSAAYVLSSIQVTPSNETAPRNVNIQYTAAGIYTNGSIQYTHDLTSDPNLNWSSTVPAVASIINSGVNKGTASTLTAGDTIIKSVYSYGGSTITGQADLNVTAAALSSIQVTPAAGTLPIGVTQQYAATGIYNDGTTRVLNGTSGLNWNSTSTTVATVSETGLVSTISSGSANIRAAMSGVIGSTGLTVLSSSYVLTTVQVTPSVLTSGIGVHIQYTATGIYSNGTSYYTHDLTSDPGTAWSVSEDDEAMASVSAEGLVYTKATTGLSAIQIKASHSGKTGSADLTITAATLNRIVVEPAGLTLPVSVSRQYTATGIFTDGTSADITSDPSIMWSTSDSEKASVTADGLVTTVSGGATVQVTAVLGTLQGSASLTISGAEVTLQSVTVTPANLSRPRSFSQQYTATGNYNNGTSVDLTADPGISWTSTNTSAASISSTGLANTLTAGSTSIRARHSGVTGSTTLTVTSATLSSINITPAAASKPVNTTQQYTAAAVYSDGTSADISSDPSIMWSWSSGDGGAVSIDSSGLAYALTAGNVKIRALYSGRADEADLEVTGATLSSIQVTPVSERKPAGVHVQYEARGYYNDSTSHDLTVNPGLVWSSSDSTKAVIDAAGLAYTISVSPAVTITASMDGKSGTASLEVTAETLSRIQVTPADQTRGTGVSLQYTATGFYSSGSSVDLTSEPGLMWGSSSSTAASISSSGLATTLAAGTTTIGAAFGAVTGTTSLTVNAAITPQSIMVTPVNLSKPAGITLQYTAVAVYSDFSTHDITNDPSVTWRSSDTGDVLINSAGLASTISSGSVTISAVYAGLTGTTSLAVTTAALEAVQVTPSDLLRPIGVSVQYTATGFYSDGTTHDVTNDPNTMWSSSVASVATVNSSGLAYTRAQGSADITARFSGIDGSADLSVTSAVLSSIVVTPSTLRKPADVSVQLAATGIFSDNTSYDMTTDPAVMWSSSDTTKAVVSSEGLLTTRAAGTGIEIRATHISGAWDKTDLTVTDATLDSIQVTPVTAERPRDFSQQYQAVGLYNDSTAHSLTVDPGTSWSSSNTLRAVIGSEGLARTITAGGLFIRAAHSGITGSASLTVLNATLDTITLAPAAVTKPVNVTQQYTATGNYGGTDYNITADPYISWASSDLAKAAVNSSGLAYTLAGTAGTPVEITAVLSGKTGTAELSIDASLALQEIVVTDAGLIKPVNVSFQYTATGTYTGGVPHDLTVNPGILWKSSNTGVAIINSTGRASTLAAGGPIDIDAVFDGKTGSTDLTVVAGDLESIVITPADTTWPENRFEQYFATGHYDGGATHDLTNDPGIAWYTEDSPIAVVSPSGMVQTLASGTTNVKAYMASANVEGETSITVTGTPIIMSVTSASDNGFYREGAEIDVTVNFSVNVTLAGGNLTVSLDSGGTVVIAPFADSNTASGTYTVAAGQNSADLTASSPLVLDGGATLRDSEERNVLLNIPAGRSLADYKSIVIDTIKPVITLISPASGSFVNTQRIEYSLSEVLSEGRITWVYPPIPAVSPGQSLANEERDAGTHVKITGVALTTDTLYHVRVTGKDMAGNEAVFVQNDNITYDITEPFVTSVTSTSDNKSYKAGDTVNVTVNFSENVTLSGGNLVVALDTGVSVTISSINGTDTASGTYTVASLHATDDLTATGISLSAGTLRDAAGNDCDISSIPAGQNIADFKNIVIDTTAPFVTSLTSTSDNKAYRAGDTVNVTVNFSENVTLSGGNLVVTLNTGGIVNISPISGTNIAGGTYTVAAGHTTPDLAANSPLTISGGGTLRDAAGNNTTLAIPGGQNIADLNDIVIDTTVPFVTSVYSTSDNKAYKAGDTVNVTVNFSENVTLNGGTLVVNLDTGGSVNISPISGTNTASGTYTVAAGHTSADLTAVGPLALSGGGTLRDAAGNDTTLTIPAGQNIADANNIIIDTTAPYVTSVTSTTATGYYNEADEISVTVNFSENVTLAGGNLTVPLNSGGSVTITSISNSNTAGGTYTVAAGHNAADLAAVSPLTLTGTLRDAAANDTTLTIPAGQNISNTKDIVVDTTAPTFTNIHPATGAFVSNTTVRFTLSETLNVVDVAEVVWTWTGGTDDSSSPHKKDIDVTKRVVGDNEIVFAVPPTLVSGAVYTISFSGYDMAGNASTAAQVTNITFDTTKPTVRNVAVNGDNVGLSTTYLNKADAGSVSVRIVFDTVMDTDTNPSPTITGLNGSPYTITGSSWSTTTESNDTWTGTFTFTDSNETATGTFNISGFSSDPGMFMDPNNTITVKADTVTPVITFTSPADSSYVNTTALTYSLSEAFGAATVTWTYSSGTTDGASPHAKTLSAEERTSGAHINIVLADPPSLVSGAVYSAAFAGSDLAGNLATVVTKTAVTYDTTAPYVTSVTSTSDNKSYKQGDSVNVTVNFSENVTLAGGNLVVTLDSGGTVTISPISGTNTASGTYTVGAGNSSSDLTADSPLALSGGGTLRDAAGNNCTLTIPAGQNIANLKDIVIDTTAPYVTSVTSISDNKAYKTGDTVNVTVDFSENVTLSGGNLVVTLDSGGTVNISPISGTNTASGTYTVADSQNSADLTAVSPLTLSGGTLKDAAGNDCTLTIPAGQNIADSKQIVIDTTAPYIDFVTSSSSDGAYGPGASVNVTVRFSEPVTLSGGTLDVTLDTGAVVPVSGSYPAQEFTGEYIVQSGDNSSDLDSTVVSLTGGGAALTDAAGNSANLALTGDTIADLKAIRIDGVKPTIVSAQTMDADGDGKIDHYKITFSEPVLDSSFPGYVVNADTGTQSAWEVYEYTNVRPAHGLAAPEADTSNDAVIYLKFSEKTAFDTGAMPDLTTTASPGLTDTAGNVIDQVSTLTITRLDGAAPVIVQARGITPSTALSITFSEPVDSDGSTGGGCDAALSHTNFVYTNASGDGAASLTGITDTNGCDDNKVIVTLNAAFAATDVNVDRINAVLDSVYDVYDNPVASDLKVVTGAISPEVRGAVATGPRKIRVTFSEAVISENDTHLDWGISAMNPANYALVESPVESGCGGSGENSISLTGTVSKISDSVYELSTNLDQCSTTTYRVTVSNVVDVDDGVGLIVNYATFLGNERLKMSGAACIVDELTTIYVTFNKAVKSGTTTGGAENTARYKLAGVSNLGTISAAVRGGASNDQVTLTHSLDQTGGNYTVIGANGVDGDGFADTSIGAIQVDGSTENLQLSPRDRFTFAGCGEAIENFNQGPISSNPFGDDPNDPDNVTDFGYLTSYADKVYIGPNLKGNSAVRLDPDGGNATNIYFSFVKDTNTAGGGTHLNTATTRVEGADTFAVPPYVTIGHDGCTANNATMATGCGPDNEDGRGLFNTGTIGGTRYMFIGGARSDRYGNEPQFDYIYYSNDTSDTLNFKYLDLGSITGTVTSGLSAMVLKDNRLFAGMAKRNNNDANNTPDFGYVTFNDSDSGTGYCTVGSSCDATDGTRGRRLYVQHIDYFGGDYRNAHPNWAYYNGVDSLVVFRNYIYAANGGHNYPHRDGGIIRSATTDLPGQCTYGQPECNQWVDATPRDTYMTGVSVNVTFDASTNLRGGDLLYVTDMYGNNITGSPFSGTTLAGTTKNVPGTGFKIRLVDNGDYLQRWGFAVTSVTPVGFTGTSYDTLPQSVHNYLTFTDSSWGYAIIPDSRTAWTNAGSRYSVELPASYDLIPGDRAFAQFAEFEGNLYVTRTTCTVTGANARDAAPHTISGCNDGTDSNRQAQLWKCVPGTTGGVDTCESGDWSIIDGNSDGVTNFGQPGNRTLSMVVVNGPYLYVGFDNAGGVQIWRTKVGETNPDSEDDFIKIGDNGLGEPLIIKEIYSAISIPDASAPNKRYLYLSAGYNAIPVQVYRNVDIIE